MTGFCCLSTQTKMSNLKIDRISLSLTLLSFLPTLFFIVPSFSGSDFSKPPYRNITDTPFTLVTLCSNAVTKHCSYCNLPLNKCVHSIYTTCRMPNILFSTLSFLLQYIHALKGLLGTPY